jgi:hypothetical protein
MDVYLAVRIGVFVRPLEATMNMCTRRDVLCLSLTTFVLGSLSLARTTAAFAVNKEQAAPPVEREAWMRAWMGQDTRGLWGALKLMRFRDPMYALLEPISWYPSTDEERKYQAVTAPRGFVTDLASIPRVFFSLLRPDGEYAYAAIIHDYLYWQQEFARAEADGIFRFAMQDSGVSPLIISTLSAAVSNFGEHAWTANAATKAKGEKRILAEFPDDPTITWDVWKAKRNVFR